MHRAAVEEPLDPRQDEARLPHRPPQLVVRAHRAASAYAVAIGVGHRVVGGSVRRSRPRGQVGRRRVVSQFDPHAPRSVRRLPSGNARGGGVDGGGYGAVAHDRRVAGDREASVGGPRWAHGARGAIPRVADAWRRALLTEIAPAVDTSTTRRHRRRSSDARRAFRRRSHRGDRGVRRAGPFASSDDGSGRWRARRRGRLGQERHAPVSPDAPDRATSAMRPARGLGCMTTVGGRRAAHARRLRRPRRRALHRSPFPPVAVAALDGADARNQTETLPGDGYWSRSQPRTINVGGRYGEVKPAPLSRRPERARCRPRCSGLHDGMSTAYGSVGRAGFVAVAAGDCRLRARRLVVEAADDGRLRTVARLAPPPKTAA